ncbi:hypothetical protein [Umezawaea tangerina]|uniref:Uncharacterized protein n=1 Tax=Umezawaea tangerina TaxID=84725 RepID=A0A2T0SVT4_9PSEU|nr:hypothetical protein [Umezawaea tangerina]PRY37526.1 hypothetical protein CLV43_110338 [Umezawaea tangerina]
MIGLEHLYAAADLDPDEPVRRLARVLGQQMTPLVLSAAVAQGQAAGPHTAMLLDRQRQRVRLYEEVLAVVRAVADPVVLKGPVLAGLYPPDLVRPVRDLDLVVETEEELWAAARSLVDAYGATPSVFTLIRHEGVDHCLVGLDWPSDDPLCDSDFEVEIGTFAYAGDQAGIPLRVGFPSSAPLAQLFAVAEERCQGPFSVKHALDCAVLLAAHPDLVTGPEAEDSIRAFHLAPEIRELVAFGTRMFGGTVPERLDALADEEQARRRDEGAVDGPSRSGGRWASADNVRFGVLLNGFTRAEERHRAGGPVPGGELVHTPVGDYLMLDGVEVDAVDVEAAREVSADRWAAATPTPVG